MKTSLPKIKHGGRQRHDYKLRQKFGIGLHQYETLYQQQGGTCVICEQPDSTNRNLAVDHCHATNRVRGLLCHHCNTGLGHFNDDVKLLQRAIDYLQRSFSLPFDVQEPYPERRSRRAIVKTPAGIFDSFRSAAKHYKVDETTMAVWCGRRPPSSAHREGFTFKMLSIKRSDITEDLFA